MAIRHLFIINPTAGKKNGASVIRAAVEALRLSAPCEVRETTAPGEATAIVKAAVADKRDFVRIYACGGDGTLNEVVCGAVGADNCAVGVVPIGSGNDFVRSFEEYTRDDFLDLARQTDGECRDIDVLQIGDRYGVNVASCGYDCAVGKNMSLFKRWPGVSGGMAYKLSLLYCLGKYFTTRFRLVADGVPVEDASDRYLFAVAGNGQYYGGGFRAAPRAVPDDGLIDFVRVRRVSRLTFFRYVGAYKRGEHLEKMKQAILLRCRELQILADHPVDMNIDGEIVSMVNPVIRIKERALRLILPTVRKAATV